VARELRWDSTTTHLNDAFRDSAGRSSIEWCHVAPAAPVPPTSGSYNFLIWQLANRFVPRHGVIGDYVRLTWEAAAVSKVPLAQVDRNPDLSSIVRAARTRLELPIGNRRFERSHRARIDAIADVLIASRAEKFLIWDDIRFVRPLRSRFPNCYLAFAQRHYDYPDRETPYNLLDALVVMTPGAAARALDQLPSLDPLVCVIPNGVELDVFTPDRAAGARAREQLGIDPDSFVVCVPSKISGHKGAAYLAQWISDYWKRADVHFVIPDGFHPSCSGRLRSLLESQFREADNVSWLNGVPRDQMPSIYQLSDLTMVPAPRREAFLMTAIESMACGVPVAAVNTGAVSEYLRDGDNGFALEVASIYADGRTLIDRLVDDRQLGIRVGTQGRAYVEQHLSREKLLANFEAFFEGRLADIQSDLR
jgi:glycosyltransferase involved in cell wall biosynthesis